MNPQNKRRTTARWHSAHTHPPRRGWYEVRRPDGSPVAGQPTNWRAWGKGQWWTQIEGGWIGKPEWQGQYQWRGPAKNVMELDYKDLPALPGWEKEAVE